MRWNGNDLEIELVTGGEEDGVDNSDVDSSKLYTQPDEVALLTKNFQNKPKIY
jgi:fructose-bisphosphate aldolase class II